MTVNLFFKQFLFLLYCLAFLLAGCCDDEQPIEINCENGLEALDGNCVCPIGKFQAYGICRELKDNEWFGSTLGCPCNDSIFFKIASIEGGIAKIRLNDGINISAPNPGWDIKRVFDMKYLELMGGDSIMPISEPYGQPCYSVVSGEVELMKLYYGRFSPSGDVLNMKIVYRDFDFPHHPKDSCFVTFHK